MFIWAFVGAINIFFYVLLQHYYSGNKDRIHDLAVLPIYLLFPVQLLISNT